MQSFAEGVFEVGVDEGVEVAVEDGVGVGGFVFGAQVFDLFVGVENVAADLVAPGSLLVGTFELGEVFQMLLGGQLGEFGAQDGHGRFPVLELRALVLDGDDDAGR